MGILEKISEIEKEIARTQKNKGAEGARGLKEPGTAGGQVGWGLWGAGGARSCAGTRVVCELWGKLRGVRGKRGLGAVESLGGRWAASYCGLGESLGTVGSSGFGVWEGVSEKRCQSGLCGEAGWGWCVQLGCLWGSRVLGAGWECVWGAHGRVGVPAFLPGYISSPAGTGGSSCLSGLGARRGLCQSCWGCRLW